jgi:hypothetical protein
VASEHLEQQKRDMDDAKKAAEKLTDTLRAVLEEVYIKKNTKRTHFVCRTIYKSSLLAFLNNILCNYEN